MKYNTNANIFRRFSHHYFDSNTFGRVIIMNSVAEKLYTYLGKVIYDPDNAALDVAELPDDWQDFGRGLKFFAESVVESQRFAHALAKGDLGGDVPPRSNEIASPLKSLHASLKHLTWQTQQIAEGDYVQHVDFMGEFSDAFNKMIEQLAQRKKSESNERARLQKYIDLLLSNTPDVVLVFDKEGKTVLASEAYITRSGLPPLNEIRGKTFTELFTCVSAQEFIDNMNVSIRDAMENANTIKTEQTIGFCGKENSRDYDIYVTPMLDDNGTMMGTMLSFHDTTEIKQAHREAELARELAERSTRAKSEFLARMSHEIRTPLNAIIGMTAIGGMSDRIEKKDDSFRKIDDASKHLLGVINDILDMSKIEANKFELSCSEFYFHKMLDHVTSIISMRIAEMDQSFVVDIDKDIPGIIYSDEQHLAQVITNLLSNAVKFTPSNGKITLIAKKTGSCEDSCSIRFTVKDSGIGMTEEQQNHLFVPFEQADGSISRRFGGTGLGLSISKRIVELMGGRIWVESAPGKGSSFHVEITVRASDELVIADEDGTETRTVKGIFKGKRVLIAEDVEINRSIISSILEDTGIEIDFACNGSDAVDRYKSARGVYDLILMDIHMPEMDGYEATGRIRASDQKVPIIAMTANVFREDIERCLMAGMNDHLGKPVDIGEIISTLRTYLNKRKDEGHNEKRNQREADRCAV